MNFIEAANQIFGFLPIISALALGLLVGSLLTEATILVPYWRKLESEEFLRIHGTMGPSLYRYFAPLTVAGTMIPMITGVFSITFTSPSMSLSVVVALLSGMMLLIYFIYFKGANKSFETGSVSVEGLPNELKRWAAWHWLRVVIGLLAFTLSIVALK